MPKVLIVDDSGLARRAVRAILESDGHQVVEATDGMTAIEQYYIEKPDAVMLDLVMKGMYGLEVLEKIKELDPAARVIVVTADVQSSSHQLVNLAGARAFVNKPVERDQLLAVVHRVLEGR
jgi:two-component system chemotaxis response regulator CheY